MHALEPVLLRADNFTPAHRTPWGGTRLRAHYKRERDLSIEARNLTVIGESWEISVEPDFPAFLDSGTPLSTWIARDPGAALGDEFTRGRTGTALLVKLIDTADPLSVQIHPNDSYEGLLAGECGKPESWYVVERDEGAGLYLGFRRGTTERDVRAALEADARDEGNKSLKELLRFVPVEPGDFFLIDAGTPHAIGAGLTLVEPQHVTPGLHGVTYRYWDWDRRYDAQGKQDPKGKPRPLHIEHALAVTKWESVQGDDFVPRIRARHGEAQLDAPASCVPLCGPVSVGGIVSNWLAVHRLCGTGSTVLPELSRLHGITVLSGEVRLGTLSVGAGRSAVVPACCAGMEVELDQAHAIVSAVV